MKNQYLIFTLCIPFILMACDENELNCSSTTALSQYNSLVSTYQNIDSANCSAAAASVDSIISFIEDNRNCIETAYVEADSTTDGEDLVRERLRAWKNTKDTYDECLRIAALYAPCGELTIAGVRENYKTAYYDAYDARDCAALGTALNNYVDYLEDNMSCVAQSSSTSEVQAEINSINNALPIINASNCNHDVLKTIGLFRDRAQPEDFNAIQAVAEYYRAEGRYQDAISDNECQSLVLNGEYMIEIYNHNEDIIIDAISSADGISASLARSILSARINNIQSNVNSVKPTCNGF